MKTSPRVRRFYWFSLTARLAGLPLTGYQKLHAELMQDLPVTTTIGFMTADGTILENEEDLPEDLRQRYNDYRIMAYNHLFDEDEHPEGFYD